jgi:hypothetical protein
MKTEHCAIKKENCTVINGYVTQTVFIGFWKECD